MASVAQLPERSYMATDSRHKYEQLDSVFLCTGGLLDPFFTLLVFIYISLDFLLPLAPFLKWKPVQNITTNSPGLAAEALIFETIQRQMSTFVLLNTSREEWRAQPREGLCSHSLLHPVSARPTVGTQEHSKTRAIGVLYSGIRLPQIQHWPSARPWVVILSQLFHASHRSVPFNVRKTVGCTDSNIRVI